MRNENNNLITDMEKSQQWFNDFGHNPELMSENEAAF